MLASLGRGALSGAVGGTLVAAFGSLLAEPLMDRAVELEAARAAALGETGTETFSRATQHFGFVGAALVVGIALGILYGVAAKLLPPSATPWGRAVRLGGAGFFGLSLVPFLRYPANPPGTGDSGTIELRSELYLLSIVIGVVGVVAAGLVVRSLAERGVRPSLRQLAVTGLLVSTVALTFVLPGNTDLIDAPVALVWEFRVLSIASLALLWGGLAATFGLLSERAAAPSTPPAVASEESPAGARAGSDLLG